MLSSPSGNPALSIVSAMITPAILILASGSLVSSTLVRLGRIVDQTRALIADGQALRSAGKTPALDFIDRRIDRQLRRAELARSALLGFYIAICLFLISSVVIAITQATHAGFFWLGPVIVIIGGVVLILATAALVFEVNVSAGTLHEEVVSYRERESERRDNA
ncbi:MAG: hypothetical protein DLM53_10040 [Candidatus Eremiobacter antarcticus]|nr:MAG: hypothetical protein DLM53_10040 [Candidatus Eremiobacter sp. RRmetagenome_bin22]